MAETVLEQTLRPIVGAIKFADAECFDIDGNHHHSNKAGNRFFGSSEEFPDVVGQVAQILYDRFYVRSDEGRGPYAPLHDALLRDDYIEQLSAANAVEWTWQTGWAFEAELDGVTRVRHPSGLIKEINSDEVREVGDGTVLVRTPSGSSTIQPGFFHISGARDADVSGAEVVRFYINCSLAGAVPLVSVLTRLLSEAGVAFHFKIVDDPQQFRRSDNAVLYTYADALDVVAPIVAATYESAGRYFRDTVPMMTKRLGPGVGYAADPGNGDSFGMHRCRLIAEGMWLAHQSGRSTARGRLSSVLRRFAAAGIPAYAPHLNSDSTPDTSITLTPFTAALLKARG